MLYSLNELWKVINCSGQYLPCRRIYSRRRDAPETDRGRFISKKDRKPIKFTIFRNYRSKKSTPMIKFKSEKLSFSNTSLTQKFDRNTIVCCQSNETLDPLHKFSLSNRRLFLSFYLLLITGTSREYPLKYATRIQEHAELMRGTPELK